MDSIRFGTLREERVKKLESLKSLGVHPYPSGAQRTHRIKVARESLGKEVTVVGRLMALRGHGKIMFADLSDESGKIQILFKQDKLAQSYELLKLFDIGDFVQVSGIIIQTKSGEVTVEASAVVLLTKSIRPLPDKWHGLTDVEERSRRRYLDLIINPETRKVFETRSKVIQLHRDFLITRGYIEVETPVLQPIYGGGLARPFKTYHNALGIPLYLRVSTELYLKRLIVGGFEKVFEFGRLFRNEGIDKSHNPEFTMLETMEAYIDYRANMKLVEEMVEQVVRAIKGTTVAEFQGITIDFKTPWKRMTMVDAVKEATGFDYHAMKNYEEAKKAAEKLGIPVKPHITSIGLVLAEIFSEKVEKTLMQPTIIYDFPYETSPLAKRCAKDPRFVERFEHYVAGSEGSNNYSELNDPLELAERFKDERKKERLGDAEAHQTDDDFIEAVEYGMPPTSGIGPGIDRLVMILTDKSHLRDVILFPTLRPKEK